MLFNEVSKLEGPWLRSRHEIKKDRYLEKTNARTDSRTSIQKRSLALKAAVPERGCTLYLQHIHMPPGDEAQHVIASIRSYVSDSSPSRSQNYEDNGIHNRAYDDVVGCRPSICCDLVIGQMVYGLPSMGKSTAKKVAAPGPQES